MQTIDRSPFVVAVVSGKGGVGKTTLSVGLAATWAADGHDTLLVDSDPQDAGSSSWWLNRCALPDSFDIEKFTDAASLSLAGDVTGYSRLVIDTPPRLDSAVLDTVCRVADYIVVVSGVGSLAVSAAVQTITNTVAPSGTPFGAVVVMVDPRRAREATEARQVLDDAGIPVLQTLLRHYAVVERAPTEGKIHTDMTGPNAGKARDDLNSITAELDNQRYVTT